MHKSKHTDERDELSLRVYYKCWESDARARSFFGAVKAEVEKERFQKSEESASKAPVLWRDT